MSDYKKQVIEWGDYNLSKIDDLRRLDRLIAERIGYYCYHYDKSYETSNFFQLWDEESDPVVLGREGERKTEAEAWADCPRFTDELDLWLYREDIKGITIHRNLAGDWSAALTGQKLGSAYYLTLTLAIAIAWLEQGVVS